MAAVSALLNSGRPSAIAGLIVAIVVDAVNGMLGRRARRHVIQKRFKVFPSLADLDAAPAIARIAISVWVPAPLDHAKPNWMKRMARQAMRLQLFFSETTTRFCVTRAQSLCERCAFCTAIAATKPMQEFPVTAHSLDGDQAPKSLTGQVEGFHRPKFTTKTINGKWAEAGVAI